MVMGWVYATCVQEREREREREVLKTKKQNQEVKFITNSHSQKYK